MMLNFYCLAQKKDTTKVAVIQSTDKANDILKQQFDSTQKEFFISCDATSILESNSNAYVKNYGLSNLSTLSIRGSSVAQTAVFWNGVPIQNTMLGLTDLSTVPNFFFDEMLVYPSGFEQEGRGQSIAGRLELNSKQKFSQTQQVGMQALLGYESFDNKIMGAKLNYSSPKCTAQLKYYNRQGANRYTFNNNFLERKDTIEHAFAVQEQLLFDLAYKPNQNHVFDFHFWKVSNFREIAPLAFGFNNQRSERNKIARFGLNHRYYKGRISWNTSLGFTTDSFRYRDQQINLSSVANTKNVPFNSSLRYFFNAKSEIGITYNQQLSFYYQKNREEQLNQYGVQLFYDHANIWKKIALHTFIRKQYASLGEDPITYGMKLSRKILKQYLVFASYNSNYRLPTLNELYYFPGGNENLLPELSRNIELGSKLVFAKDRLKIENVTSLYSRYVKDWIIWTGSAIFFPDNIAEVWSRGIESNLSVKYTINEVALRNDFLIALNRSSSEKPYFVNDLSVGKQIPYVPRLNWRNNLYAQYKKYNAQLHLGYTGYRFVTRDESEFVDPYTLVNFYLGRKFSIGRKLQTQLQLKLNNILNANYQSVRGRIMPGRNYALSILLKK